MSNSAAAQELLTYEHLPDYIDHLRDKAFDAATERTAALERTADLNQKLTKMEAKLDKETEEADNLAEKCDGLHACTPRCASSR